MAAGLRGAERGVPGGSCGLAELIGEHQSAFAYDWRTRFSASIDDIGESMTWGEAASLVRILCQDPTSWVAAAVAGWTHPVSREWIATTDLYDLTHMIAWRSGGSKGSQPKPYPRPWITERRTAKPTVSQEVVRAALRRAGHTNLPVE